MEHKVFGCKVNKFYLNRWLHYFQQHPHFADGNKSLVATCVVTDRAKSKRVKDVKKRLQTGQQVYLTGCGAFEKGAAMNYDKFFHIYPDLQPYREDLFLLGEDPDEYNEHLEVADYELNQEVDAQQNKIRDLRQKLKKNIYTKKFVVIQSGCDTFCTFCLTIYKRGQHRSRSLDSIIREINTFVAQGGKEIVITGVNLASWGASHTRKAHENQFADLLEQILRQTAISRIRISSLGPEFLTEKFYDVVSDTRFLPHFHFSLQSFSSKVLRLMNRNYDADVLHDCMTRIRALDRPDHDKISIGGDIIVGFPGETPEEFQYTYDAIEQYGLTKLHAFPFSPHQKGETVPAGKLPDQVPQPEKKQRERVLIAHANAYRKKRIETQKGKECAVLLESQKDGVWTGWTDNYIQARVKGNYQRGDVVKVVL